MTDRYSSPPSAEKLEASTRRLTAANKTLAAKVGHLPMPASVTAAAIDLTDEQLLAFCRRLWSFHNAKGYIHVDQSLTAFEREARERIEGR
jgi:hypothetical protein